MKIKLLISVISLLLIIFSIEMVRYNNDVDRVRREFEIKWNNKDFNSEISNCVFKSNCVFYTHMLNQGKYIIN